MCGIANKGMLRNEPPCAGSPEVNKLLFDLIGGDELRNCDEPTLLNHNKSVSVHGSYKEVHRQRFHGLTDGR